MEIIGVMELYAYIIGKVAKITPRFIVVENNGIGYMLIVSNPYNYKIDEEIKIYTYQHIREESNDIYGFKTEEGKDLFLKLISVNGIGPKSALSILASGSVKEIINAIENRDDVYLRKFPGIGPKASQQIILDLKGKISFEEAGDIIRHDTKIKDCEEALVSLGYSRKDAAKVLSKIDSTLEEGQIVREALKMMIK